jgi:hypothetical protein
MIDNRDREKKRISLNFHYKLKRIISLKINMINLILLIIVLSLRLYRNKQSKESLSKICCQIEIRIRSLLRSNKSIIIVINYCVYKIIRISVLVKKIVLKRKQWRTQKVEKWNKKRAPLSRIARPISIFEVGQLLVSFFVFDPFIYLVLSIGGCYLFLFVKYLSKIKTKS